MPSAGELLRSERLQQQKNLSEIATETCISTRYLAAIEADDVSQLPGEFFYKAFLRQYAKSLCLDEAKTKLVMASAVLMEEPDPVPALSHAYDNSEGARETRWAPPTAVAVGLLLAVLAGGSGLYAWWQNAKAQKETAVVQETPPPAGNPPVASASAVPSEPGQLATRQRSATPPPQEAAAPNRNRP